VPPLRRVRAPQGLGEAPGAISRPDGAEESGQTEATVGRSKCVGITADQRNHSVLSVLPVVKTDTSNMLPCEFCEGLIPVEKLLEHQAQCVNPQNVRGSQSLRASASVTSFSAAMAAAAGNSNDASATAIFGGLSRSHSVRSRRYCEHDEDYSV